MARSAKTRTVFLCDSCGADTPRWEGRCPSCGEWNTLKEMSEPVGAPAATSWTTKAEAIRLSDVSTLETPRLQFSSAEVDRVLGGGMVPGSLALIAGDPGIGKSTLLLQAAGTLADGGASAVYVSGEESADQVRLRASRLGLSKSPVSMVAATSVRDLLTTLDADAPDVLIIDSIQTMYVDSLESAPGTVAQVRASAQELIRLAKRRGTVLLLVGHVTKEGQIAGPRVLEHMVDTVLYFEGERGHQFRILRAVKNRFGATDEIGVFEMTDAGLGEVSNPSALFLAERETPVSGAAVFAGMEGTRPLLVEIEALVSPSPLGTPRRTVVGWDSARLAMILAVLETRCGLAVGANDVYLNVAGGLRVSEPAADLAVVAALISSLGDRPLPERTVAFGEVGLSGEVRPVTHTEARLREALKLGFTRALMRPPRGNVAAGMDCIEIARLPDMVQQLADVSDLT